MSDCDVLTVVEVAAMLRVAASSVYEAVRRGELPHFRVGGLIRFSRQGIQEVINRGMLKAEDSR